MFSRGDDFIGLLDPPADSLSASEYESGFRAGEREPLRTSRARARFLQGCLLHPFRERYTYVTRSQQRSQQVRNDIVFALLRSRALGRAFLCLCSSSSVRSRARGLCAGLRSPAISGGSVVPGGLVLHLAWPSHCSSWVYLERCVRCLHILDGLCIRDCA